MSILSQLAAMEFQLLFNHCLKVKESLVHEKGLQENYVACSLYTFCLAVLESQPGFVYRRFITDFCLGTCSIMKYFRGQDQSNCSSKQVNDRFVAEAAPLSPSGTARYSTTELPIEFHVEEIRNRYMAYIMDTNEEERVKVHLILKELVRKSLSATQVLQKYVKNWISIAVPFQDK
ncbi:hypothetical protein LOK49_Contig123G00009 [Camellia lanceoleosa]|nr:hypothetical protein LOK49_Contig123G00009 [Camellia lanceoleosa]